MTKWNGSILIVKWFDHIWASSRRHCKLYTAL